MSSFMCPDCNAQIIEGPGGHYLTGCEHFPRWPDCSTPECPSKVCTWGSADKCYICEEQIVGKKEMRRRYDITHERPWESRKSPNYMLKTFAEIDGK